MAERLNMAGEGNLSPDIAPTGVNPTVEPSVVIAQEPQLKRSPLGRFFNRGPKMQVLIKPGEQPHVVTQPPEGVSPSVEIFRKAGYIEQAVSQARWQSEPVEIRGQLGPVPERESEPGDPDYLWSKEFRRDQKALAKEIYELEALTDEKKEEVIDETTTIRDRINELFEAWKVSVDSSGEKMLQMEPFPSEEELAAEEALVRETIPEQDFSGVAPLKDVIGRDRRTVETEGLESDYEYLLNLTNPTADQITELATVKEQMSRYFKEARRRDLLDEVDKELNSIYVEIREGLQANLQLDEILSGTDRRQGLNARIRELVNISQRRFKTKRSNDNSLSILNGVSELYIQFAIDRFMTVDQPGGMEPSAIEGGFNFAAENSAAYKAMSKHKELYWSPNYADYYNVTARTPEQFRIALDTFMMWVRASISKEPNEIFGKLRGFKDAITQAGTREGVDVTDIRQELEVLVGVIAGSHANEQYEEGNLTQLLMHTTQGGEGPQRWLQLPKTGRGKFAALMHKLDKDPRAELLFATFGTGGQLATKDAPIAQWMLRQHIIEMLTAEAMGIEIKAYHLGDSQMRLAEELNGKLDPLNQNLARIAMFQSDEEFKNLFEGFDLEDQETLFQQLDPIAQKMKWAQGIDEQYGRGEQPVLNEEDTRIYQDFKDGKIMLKKSEFKTWERLERARRIQNYLEDGNEPNKLEGDDKTMWDEAKSAMTLVLEVYGVTGEKAKRGGGAYIVHRKDSLGREIVEYIPPHLCEAFVQFAENWTKIKYADAPAVFLEKALADTRKSAIEALVTNGRAAKLTDVDYDVTYQLATKDKKGKAYAVSQLEIAEIAQRPVVKEMLLKRPKENPDGSVFRNAAGDTEADDGVSVTFDIAVHHIYSRSSSHTYPGYQEENRELVLKEKSFKDAKKIEQGLLRPGDAYPPALQRLILDPTLNRIAKFENNREREDKVALAAVEYTYQGGNQISDEVFSAFFPDDADPEKINISYNLQDDGGSTKTWEAFRLLVVQEPERYARRFRTKTAGMFLRFRPMTDAWGAPNGVLDVFRMFNYPEYRMVGQQALQKWIKQTAAAQKVIEAYTGTFNEQQNKFEEGFSNKPKNNGDMIVQSHNKTSTMTGREDEYNEFLYKDLETKGRLWVVSRAMFNLESVTRTDHAPLLLRGIDIFQRNVDGSFKLDASNQKIYNTQIDRERDAGSARHDFHKFYYEYFIPWLRSKKSDEAFSSYQAEQVYNDLLEQVMPASKRVEGDETGDDWGYGKIVGSY